MRPRPKGEADVIAYVKAHPEKSDREIADAFGIKYYTVTNIRNRHGLKKTPAAAIPRSLKEAVEFDKKNRAVQDRELDLEEKYEYLLRENETLKEEIGAAFRLKNGPQITKILPSFGSGTSEATAFALASDWHIEERVRPEEVNGLNEYTLAIARDRTTKFFQNLLKLERMAEQNVAIKTLLLCLLGDFISGSIHDELMEINELAPSDAIWEAQNIIASGIDFLLNNSKLNLVIPCKSGNHGRTTKKQRHATEEGNSLESFMYRNLALHYKNEKRVNFILSDGYHIYLDVYSYVARIHHGHAINFAGGVGGIYIPVNKAIAQWNKARKADLDLFGHFHQARDGGNFISNGSAIGHNAYAVSIKAEYEKPRQQFFLIDKKRFKTLVAPILLD